MYLSFVWLNFSTDFSSLFSLSYKEVSHSPCVVITRASYTLPTPKAHCEPRILYGVAISFFAGNPRKRTALSCAPRNERRRTSPATITEFFRERSRRRVLLVREAGVEPARGLTHWILNPARLPFRHSRNT